MSVTVRGRLPKGDLNGLAALEGVLSKRNAKSKVHVAVVLIRADTIEEHLHDDDDPRKVKTVIMHVEPLEEAAAATADELLRQAYAERTGKTPLPFGSWNPDKPGSDPARGNVEHEDDSDGDDGGMHAV